MPLKYFSHTFHRELEKEFTVVQWDQRGAVSLYEKSDKFERFLLTKVLGSFAIKNFKLLS